MTLPTPVQLKGTPGSPYTRKMLAVLRYRHIPYEFLIGNQADAMDLPQAKVNLLPTFYLLNDAGELRAEVDSTPLIRRFEAEFEGRSTIPSNPVMAFLNYLIEDYGDEWLTKAMFHYRWYYDTDIKKAAKILPRWRLQQSSDEDLAKMEKYIGERQISRLYVVGSNNITAPVIEASYRRFLKQLDKILSRHPFVFGSRPSSADFALYAQLTQLAKFDPTPASICLKESPRVYAWVDIVDDLTGQPAEADAWLNVAEVKEHLFGLLSEIGRTYTPALLANARAISSGDNQMQAVIDGKAWEQPAFPYQAKCLEWIREEFSALSPEDQTTVLTILDGTGCEALLV